MLERIVIAVGAPFGINMWEPICRYAQEREGVESHVLAWSEDLGKPFEALPDLFKTVRCCEHILKGYGSWPIDREALLRFARKFEEDSGELVVDFLHADRHLGHGYFYTSRRNPTSTLSAKANYWDSLRILQEHVNFFDALLDEVDPSVLIMEAAGSLPTKALAVAARRRGIPVRFPGTARIGNRYVWHWDEYYRIPPLEAVYQNTPPPENADAETADGYRASKEGLALAAKKLQLTGVFGYLYRRTRDWSIRKLRKWIKGKERFPEYHLFSTLWGWGVRSYTQRRYLERLVAKQTENIVPGTYFFYPLHHEPEASLQVQAPLFNNQVALIDLIAKALPAGVMLVVKEHIPSVAARVEGLYDWLNDIPNVILAPLDANGAALARESLATVVITGTSGLEAGTAGVPVISFCDRIFFNVMDHVHVLTDFAQLRPLVRQIVAEKDDDELKARRRRDGQRFMKALHDVSFDVKRSVFHVTKQPLLPDVVETFYDRLKETLT